MLPLHPVVHRHEVPSDPHLRRPPEHQGQLDGSGPGSPQQGRSPAHCCRPNSTTAAPTRIDPPDPRLAAARSPAGRRQRRHERSPLQASRK